MSSPSSWDNLNFQSTSFLSYAYGTPAMLFVEEYLGSLERCSAPGLPLGKTQTFASRTFYTWIGCSWVFTAGNTGLVLRYFSPLLLWFSRVAQYEVAETVNSERIMRRPSETVFCFLWVRLYYFHLFSYVHPDLAHNLLSKVSVLTILLLLHIVWRWIKGSIQFLCPSEWLSISSHLLSAWHSPESLGKKSLNEGLFRLGCFIGVSSCLINSRGETLPITGGTVI